MFSGLRQNSVVYVLDKKDKPSLRVGQVVSVSAPQPKIGQMPYSSDTFVDVVVKVGEETINLNQMPSALSIANFGSSMVVSDNKEAMLSEVEGLKRISEDVLANVDYHKGVITACEEMTATLNPSLAKERETDERIGAIEQRMGGVESILQDINASLASLTKSVS